MMCALPSAVAMARSAVTAIVPDAGAVVPGAATGGRRRL
jgi:hypothetical protein